MSSRYDRAVTIFSPDGHLLQVEYAQEAVRKGSTVVGIKGKDAIVLGVEKRSAPKLQEEGTVRKICLLDEHCFMAFAGLTADARILILDMKRECQNYRLSSEDPASIEYITRYIAEMKQKYTQSNGRRPFGVSCIVGGFDWENGEARLFQTEPSGIYYEWYVATTGRSAKITREFLEQYYRPNLSSEEITRLTVRSLMEVAQSGQKNLEIAVMQRNQEMKFLTSDEIEKIVDEIEKEREEENEKKKQKKI